MTFLGLAILGIRKICLWLKIVGLSCSLKMCKHIVTTLLRIVCQCFLKKTVEKPFGPRGFVRHIEDRASIIFSSVNSFFSWAFISEVKHSLQDNMNLALVWAARGEKLLKVIAKLSFYFISLSCSVLLIFFYFPYFIISLSIEYFGVENFVFLSPPLS